MSFGLFNFFLFYPLLYNIFGFKTAIRIAVGEPIPSIQDVSRGESYPEKQKDTANLGVQLDF